MIGHDSAVRETARITEKRVELDHYMKKELNHKLQILKKKIKEEPEVKITYFVPDDKKDGGVYLTTTGRIKKIDEYKREILMKNGVLVPIDEIIKVEEEAFNN